MPGIKEIIAHNRERVISGIEAVKALDLVRANPRTRPPGAPAGPPAGSRLRPVAAQIRRLDGRGHARAHRPRRGRHHSARHPAVLGLPPDGGARFRDGRAVQPRRCSTRSGQLRREAVAAALGLWSLPMPWIACEVGWFVAEYGRQPWTIYGVLPTRLYRSTLSVSSSVRWPASSALHPAAHRRDVPDGEVRPPGPRQSAPAAISTKSRTPEQGEIQ